MADTPDRWMLIDPAAAHVGVSRRSIYNWITAGKIGTKRTRLGSLLVRLSDVAYCANLRPHGPGLGRPKATTHAEARS